MAKATKPAPDAEQKPEVPTVKRSFYEEWEVKISYNKEEKRNTYEKLKMKRPRVLISDYQAEILNEGVLNGGNNYAVMYFLPE